VTPAFAAQWLTGRLPCQRFISNLAMRYRDSAPFLFTITRILTKAASQSFPLKDLHFTLCRSLGALAFLPLLPDFHIQRYSAPGDTNVFTGPSMMNARNIEKQLKKIRKELA
jgi:hypothetical protein